MVKNKSSPHKSASHHVKDNMFAPQPQAGKKTSHPGRVQQSAAKSALLASASHLNGNLIFFFVVITTILIPLHSLPLFHLLDQISEYSVCILGQQIAHLDRLAR